jgi:hypothetical protein
MRIFAVELSTLACSAILLLVSQSAFAEDQSCSGFSWPLETEVGWMRATDSEAVQSGGTIAALPAKAVTLTLKPSKSEPLPVVSGVKKQVVGTDSFSGWVKIGNLEKAGLYQVSLSREGWIDVAQNGKLIDSTGFTGRRECTVLRKSVRYELSQGETLIQVVGAPVDSIKVTIKPAN